MNSGANKEQKTVKSFARKISRSDRNRQIRNARHDKDKLLVVFAGTLGKDELATLSSKRNRYFPGLGAVNIAEVRLNAPPTFRNSCV